MSWQFARTSKWIVRHVLVVVLVAAMVWAGFWQLRRLDEKREHRDTVLARQEEPVADVREVVPASADVGDPEVEEVLYRTVTATGRYADDETVVVENRSFNGAPGGWVLTPLVVEEGVAVVVNRGFLGFDRAGEIVPPPAPEGEVTVQGLVLPSQERGRLGPTDPAEGELDTLARADLERYEAQLEVDLLPAYVQLAASDPPEQPAGEGSAELVALGEPELDLGPHLGYAVQWFIFSAIAAVGYLILLRKLAKERSQDLPSPERDELDDELEELLRSQR